MGRVLDLVMTAVGLAAVVVVGMLVRREFFTSVPATSEAQSKVHTAITPSDWARLRTAVTWVGPERRPVQVIEFADFQCPFCARLHVPLRELQQQHGDSVAFGFAHFPLHQIHPYAYDAALSAVCAEKQGHFADMADALFSHQASFGLISFDSLAHLARVPDLSRFDRCRKEPGTRSVVDTDVAWANRLALDGTPTVYVNGRLVPPESDPAYVERAVEGALTSH